MSLTVDRAIRDTSHRTRQTGGFGEVWKSRRWWLFKAVKIIAAVCRTD